MPMCSASSARVLSSFAKRSERMGFVARVGRHCGELLRYPTIFVIELTTPPGALAPCGTLG
jgi:hypothetical protein